MTLSKDVAFLQDCWRGDLSIVANLYMRRFVLGWKTLGHQQRFQARIVNYADDFVICCRGTAEEAMVAIGA